MTQSSTSYSRGDIILVPFGLSERSAFKRRPALVLSSDDYNSGRTDIIVAALTTRIRHPLLIGDYLIQSWRESGLPKPSVVTAILRTTKRFLIIRRMGRLPTPELVEVEQRLREVLSL
jgi:mRNA interferase MazF